MVHARLIRVESSRVESASSWVDDNGNRGKGFAKKFPREVNDAQCHEMRQGVFNWNFDWDGERVALGEIMRALVSGASDSGVCCLSRIRGKL